MKGSVSFSKLIFLMLLAMIIPTIILQKFWMLIYVPSASMAPTLKGGDLLIGSRQFSEIERGDIAVFQMDGALLIKRVIGLPGDEIRIDETGTVFVNGSALEEPYIEFQRQGQSQEFEVPEGEYLMLGDNRQHSYDSRYWEDPYIPGSSVVAIEKARILTLPFLGGDDELEQT